MAMLSSLVTMFLMYFLRTGFCDEEQNKASTPEALKSLRKYGYLPNSKGGVSDFVSAVTYRRALRAFQRFGGIKVTGVLDTASVQLLNKPRCGNPDFRSDLLVHKRRQRRYVVEGSRWGSTDITYKISRFSRDLPQVLQENEIARAFKMWSDNSALTFQRVSPNSYADIDIGFAVGTHGDGNPFDGPGGDLAHAYSPSSRSLAGDVHFDEDETWTAGTFQGTNLFQTAVHELGHSLGLEHSLVQTAVMNPFYKGYSPNFQLDPDDIDGIQYLYGRNEETPETKDSITTTSTTQVAPDLCNDPSIEAAALFRYDYFETLFAFKQGYIVPLKYPYSTPEPIEHSKFRNGPIGTIDAALFWPGRYSRKRGQYDVLSPARTYLFKGSQVWRYEEEGLMPGYPVAISQEFPGIPDDIDGAAHVGNMLETYFFKGGEFWRYQQNHSVDEGYPKEAGPSWNGFMHDIHDTIHDTFESKYGHTYFSRGDSLYTIRYSRLSGAKTSVLKVFARDMIDCSDDSLELRELKLQGPGFLEIGEVTADTDQTHGTTSDVTPEYAHSASDADKEDVSFDDGFQTDDSGHLYPTLTALSISLTLALLM